MNQGQPMDVDNVAVSGTSFSQEDLNDETEREIDSPIREAATAKKASGDKKAAETKATLEPTRKSTRTKQKSTNSSNGSSVHFDFSSDSDFGGAKSGGDPDLRDMDPDFDPECTMAMQGPSRSVKTRKRTRRAKK